MSIPLQFRIILFLFFSFSNTYSQSVGLISVYQDQKENFSVNTIESAPFIPVYEFVNNGMNNGMYWFKIKFQDSTQTQQVIDIKSAHITEGRLFSETREILPDPNERFLTFSINPPFQHAYYLQVMCHKEAYIPIRVINRTDYLIEEQNELLQIGLYYGIILALIFLNSIYYFNFKNSSYLYYIFILISMEITLGYRDGLAYLFFSSTPFINYLEALFNLFVAIALALFTTKYLQVNTHLPKFKWIGIGFICISALLYLIYLFSRSSLFFALTEFSILASLTVYWATSIILFNHQRYSKFYCIAYGLILVICYDFYIGSILGYPLLGVDLNFLKIASITEIALFTFAISSQGKHHSISNKKYESDQMECPTHHNQFDPGFSLENPSDSTRPKINIEEHLLTCREAEILRKIQQGKSNKEIASDLNVSVNTIKYHIKNIYVKLNISSRKEIANKTLIIFQQ